MPEFRPLPLYMGEGTSYLIDIRISYDKLVKTFGEPNGSGNNKSKAEWILGFDDGCIATIYDWKWYDTEVAEIPVWNIGGNRSHAATHIENLL